jgi:hypothetical protein
MYLNLHIWNVVFLNISEYTDTCILPIEDLLDGEKCVDNASPAMSLDFKENNDKNVYYI